MYNVWSGHRNAFRLKSPSISTSLTKLNQPPGRSNLPKCKLSPRKMKLATGRCVIGGGGDAGQWMNLLIRAVWERRWILIDACRFLRLIWIWYRVAPCGGGEIQLSSNFCYKYIISRLPLRVSISFVAFSWIEKLYPAVSVTPLPYLVCSNVCRCYRNVCFHFA